VQGNPFRGRYIEDGAMHQIHVSANGYVAKTEAVAFDHDITLAVSLERIPMARVPVVAPHTTPHVVATPHPAPVEVAQPTPVVTPPPQPTGPAVPPTTLSTTKVDPIPAGGTKPHHTIDPNNPYAK